jgi:predicted TPR repeat methyltransferase
MEHDVSLDALAWEQRGTLARDAGRAAEAEACFEKALADGERPIALLGLALSQIDQNRPADAIENLRKARELAPKSGVVSHLHNALTGNPTGRAPDSFVTWLFDAKAFAFDNHLASLGYQGPEMLRQLAERAGWVAEGKRHILDLGCGTGLSGLPFHSHAASLHGVDLSAGMLAQAQQRGIYDRLDKSEVHLALQQYTPLHYDAVLAADMLIYVGELTDMFSLIAKLLKPGGSFLFTVETAEVGFMLTQSGRYSHSDAYLRRSLPTSMHCADVIDGMIRVEAGKFTPARAYRFVKTVN